MLRIMHHSNSLIVTGEIAVLPLAFGVWQIALAFRVLNATLLVWRIRVENGALAARRERVTGVSGRVASSPGDATTRSSER